MILKDLINEVCNVPDLNSSLVIQQLLMIYKEEANRVRDGLYNTLISLLLKTTPASHSVIIKVRQSTASKYVVATYTNTVGIETDIAIEFIPFEDWLGCRVEDDFTTISKEEFVAHCLYQMSYIGFNEPSRQKNINSIEKRIIEQSNNEEFLYHKYDDGKVKLNSSDNLDFMENKLDSETLEINNGKVRVKTEHINTDIEKINENLELLNEAKGMVGSKKVDENNIGQGKVLGYDTSNDKIVYIQLPKFQPQRKYIYTPPSGVTTNTIPLPFNYTVGEDELIVFLNGLVTDCIEIDDRTIKMPLNITHEDQVLVYKPCSFK